MNQPVIILVVDDIAANRETLRELLDVPDYQVVEAADGPTALRLAEETPPDLVLLDVMMPGMDGYEVCRRLRANARLAEVPVIMVTALDDSASRLAGIEAGADDFITKPFNRIELRARVRTVARLNRYRRLVEAHAALRESDRKFLSVFQHASVGLVIAEAPELRFVDVNPRFCEMLGYAAAELLQLTARDITDPECLEMDKQQIEEIRLGHTQYCSWEKRYRKKDGSCVWAKVFVAPLNPHDTNGTRMIGVIEDITAQKKLEAHLLQAQRIENLGALAGGLAHDLNNVLAPVLMAAALLKERVTADRDRKLVATVEACAQRGADIVRQVLTFARGIKGERVPVELRHVLADMVDIATETFPPTIEVILEAPKNLWLVLGDATQFHQILMNLCINARDAMPQGGRLTLTAENCELDDAFATMTPGAKPGPYVCLKVSDTGMGIPVENQAKIFEPFFTTKEPGKGTGLGLATVLGITTSHGGFLRLKSTLNRGTCFEVYLPATPAADLPVSATGRAEPARGEGQVILVVDDEAAIRSVAAMILEKHGYRPLCAVDGIEAMAIYVQQTGAVAAVVTDMVMPGMDGPVLIRTLRLINPLLPVLGMTGFGEPGELKRFEALGLSALLMKPFTAAKLLTTLHAALHSPPGTKVGSSVSPWLVSSVPPTAVPA